MLDYNCHSLKTGQTPGCNLPKGYETSIIDDSFDYSVVMKYFINFSWKIYLLADWQDQGCQVQYYSLTVNQVIGKTPDLIQNHETVIRLLPSPPNVIYSRFWYAFSLFLRKFHSVKIFNSNFCKPGQAQFAEKKMEFPSQVVSKTYFILFSAKFGPFSNPFRGRAECTCRMNLIMSWLV